MKNEIRHYSASQKLLYGKCPRKYAGRYGEDGKKDLPNEPMIEGSKKHLDVANYLTGIGEKPNLPYNFDMFVSRLGDPELFHIEEKILIEYLDFELIGYVDLFLYENMKLTIVDWKNGFMDGDEEQLKIYASALIEKYPEAQVIVGYFYYTGDFGKRYQRFVWTREDIEQYAIELEEALCSLHTETEFPGKASCLCNTCSESWECLEAKKYKFLPIRNDAEFLDIMEKQRIAKAFDDQAQTVMRRYMFENEKDMVIDGVNKAYLSSSVIMRKGKLTKDEMSDMIISIKPDENKKVLMKMKAPELAEMLSDVSKMEHTEEKELIDVEITEEERKLIDQETGSAEKETEAFPLEDQTAEKERTKLLREKSLMDCVDIDGCNTTEERPYNLDVAGNPTTEPITLKDIRKLAVRKKAIENTRKGWTDYQKKLKERFDVKSCMELSDDQRLEVFRELED